MTPDTRRPYDEEHLCAGPMANSVKAYPNAEAYNHSAEDRLQSCASAHAHECRRFSPIPEQPSTATIDRTIPCETMTRDISANNQEVVLPMLITVEMRSPQPPQHIVRCARLTTASAKRQDQCFPEVIAPFEGQFEERIEKCARPGPT